VALDEGETVHIAARAARWRFSHPTPVDEVRHDAVRAAAVFLREHQSETEGRVIATAATPLAVFAVRVHDAFVQQDASTGEVARVEADAATVQAALTAAQLDLG
jgi:hypothetical protein